MSNYKTLQIKFNLDDPFQKKLYDFVKEQTSNFSHYGKCLIQNEMNGSRRKREIEIEINDEVSVDLDSLLDDKNFI